MLLDEYSMKYEGNISEVLFECFHVCIGGNNLGGTVPTELGRLVGAEAISMSELIAMVMCLVNVTCIC